MNSVQLPSLGEGIMSGVVVSILVQEGEFIEENQSILEVETDKVTMEVPSSFAGTVLKIHAIEGEEIHVGSVIIEMEKSADQQSHEENEQVAVIEEIKVINEVNTETISVKEVVIEETMLDQLAITKKTRTGKRSSPRARKLARQLNVDPLEIRSSSPLIVREDVITHVHNNSQSNSPSIAKTELPDFSKWGSIRREKMSGIMKATAANMEKSWKEIPHAWLTEIADISLLEEERKEINKTLDLNISTTIFIVKAVTKALQKYSIFNASLDMQSQSVVYKDYINIGIAVDSPDGLYVPVLRDADTKPLSVLSAELIELSEKASTKKLSLSDLSGANFSISNLGSIGTTSIFPLVVPNQVAILGVARYQLVDSKKQLPLTIAFDHRIINGADAARFLKFVVSLLENPVKILV